MTRRTVGSQSMSRRDVLAGSAGLIGSATLASSAARSAKCQSRCARDSDQQPTAAMGSI